MNPLPENRFQQLTTTLPVLAPFLVLALPPVLAMILLPAPPPVPATALVLLPAQVLVPTPWNWSL
jgi:hypothetical protein